MQVSELQQGEQEENEAAASIAASLGVEQDQVSQMAEVAGSESSAMVNGMQETMLACESDDAAKQTLQLQIQQVQVAKLKVTCASCSSLCCAYTAHPQDPQQQQQH